MNKITRSQDHKIIGEPSDIKNQTGLIDTPVIHGLNHELATFIAKAPKDLSTDEQQLQREKHVSH